MTFSSRLPPTLSPNALSVRLAALRARGEPWLDLTETNPTAVGIAYPAELAGALSDPASARYRPDPAGLRATRELIAAEYTRRGVRVDPSAIVLTSSTSEAYSVLFKLLCDPGDTVLVPQPSYPLFDLLTRLEAVDSEPYRLEYHGAWWIDRASVAAAMTPRTRAVLVVSPNNPTGSFVRMSDLEWLMSTCREHDAAVIVDEVFADYPLAPRPDACRAVEGRDVLTFSLGGLSKAAGLPQMKLAWIAVTGPADRVADAMPRLEMIADTYLSVSTPVQLAAARLLAHGRTIRGAIASRVDRNLQTLRSMTTSHPAITLLEPEAGWSAVLRVPATMPEESLVLRALEEARVLVHPGYFFDFATEAFLVVSLLPEPAVFDTALERLLPIAGGAA